MSGLSRAVLEQHFRQAYEADLARAKEVLGAVTVPESLPDTRERAQELVGQPAPHFTLKLPSNTLYRFACLDLMRQQHPDAAYKFVGQVLLRLAGVSDMTTPASTAYPANEVVNCCSDAESYFLDVVQQVLSGQPGQQSWIRVYRDAHGPLLIRKDHEESTALTLRPLTMGSMNLAPGTIVSVHDRLEHEPVGKQDATPEANNCLVTVHDLPEHFELGLGRLSAWAYDGPERRALFACHFDDQGKVSVNVDLANRLAETSLGDFQRAADRIMQLCGVEPS